jgi:heme exporter protein D
MPDIQFSSMSDFFDMGGYALYVWSAYAFFAVVIGFSLLQPKLARKKFFKQQIARAKRENAREENI